MYISLSNNKRTKLEFYERYLKWYFHDCLSILKSFFLLKISHEWLAKFKKRIAKYFLKKLRQTNEQTNRRKKQNKNIKKIFSQLIHNQWKKATPKKCKKRFHLYSEHSTISLSQKKWTDHLNSRNRNMSNFTRIPLFSFYHFLNHYTPS